MGDCQWILELAEQKQKGAHLPFLREVQLHEDMMSDSGGGVYEMEHWEPPAVVEKFAKADILLTVMYRNRDGY